MQYVICGHISRACLKFKRKATLDVMWLSTVCGPRFSVHIRPHDDACGGKLARDDFTVKVVTKPEEVKSLLEVGFEYVCQREDLAFFRKRK